MRDQTMIVKLIKSKDNKNNKKKYSDPHRQKKTFQIEIWEGEGRAIVPENHLKKPNHSFIKTFTFSRVLPVICFQSS